MALVILDEPEADTTEKTADGHSSALAEVDKVMTPDYTAEDIHKSYHAGYEQGFQASARMAEQVNDMHMFIRGLMEAVEAMGMVPAGMLPKFGQ